MRNEQFVKCRMQQVIRDELERTGLRALVSEEIACLDLQALIREQLDEFYGPVQQRRITTLKKVK